jgi:23S rRNA (cytosine1962-C5)-methyltransferase
LSFREWLEKALVLRAPVTATTDAWRWVDDDTDGFGVTIERYGDFAVVFASSERGLKDAGAWGRALLSFGVRGVYLKQRLRGDLRRVSRAQISPREPVCGQAAPAEFLVNEHGLRYHVRLTDGLSTGLFLDQRDNRQRVRAIAANGHVLNLFAYTCSFSVAAGAGGAARVTSVDLSGAVLRRGEANLRANALAAEQHRLLKDDCVKWVARAARRGEKFDIVILDPPSFGSDGSSSWSVERDYADMLVSCVGLVRSGGKLIAVTNHRQTTVAKLISQVEDACTLAGARVDGVDAPAPPLDCGPSLGQLAATKSAIACVSW